MVAMLRRLLLSFVAANVVAVLLDFLVLLAVGLVDPSAVSGASNGAITAYVVVRLAVAAWAWRRVYLMMADRASWS